MEITIDRGNGTSGNEVGALDVNLDALLETPGEPTANGSSDTKSPNEGDITVEIDDRFKHLPEAEAVARSIQSRYDKLYNDYQPLVAQMEEYKPLIEILDDLLDNDDAFYAFVNERKPELIQQKDIGVELKKQLTKEFGEGFKPSLTREQADIEDPGGKDWRYYRKLDDLYSELKQGSAYTKTASLKAYRQKKEALAKAEEERFQQQVEKAKVDLKMTDEEVERVSKWGQSLDFAKLTKLLRFVSKFPTTKAAAQISKSTGSGTPSSTARQQFLDSIKR